jgi:histidinol-phosphate/aromatic aminotransferase/cobyric acid decarboxylase-like protein
MPIEHETTPFRRLRVARRQGRIRLAVANDLQRADIYALRHQVYAGELGQHPENDSGVLRDSLDDHNLYLIASLVGQLAGFISVTPPGGPSYSIDKYVSRNSLPIAFNDSLYEIRLLTVVEPYRNSVVAALLMYAAFRWIEAHGGTRIVAIGRVAILELYLKIGLRRLGVRIQSGAVAYECLSATVSELRDQLNRNAALLRTLERRVEWQLDFPFDKPAACFHGGAFFEAVGDEFTALDRHRTIINADVLDAWFPPSPAVIAAVREHLPWLIQTSPPTGCEGLRKTIARVRDVSPNAILPGAGSSDLIFLALRQWLTPSSKVLLLDPTYGEYAHVLEQIVRCRVDRFILSRSEGYQCDLAALERRLQAAYDLVILVNPNSPTGRHIRLADLERLCSDVPDETTIWIDETYVEYAGADQSLERFAAQSANVVVCKSLSKVYALSGVRAAYLCTSPSRIETLSALTPPWAVGLPGQVAAVMALQDPAYYAKRYEQTHALREQLVKTLRALDDGMEVIPSVGNFVLCHLPAHFPNADTLCKQCRIHGLFLRDASGMGRHLGSHAVRIAVKDADTTVRMAAILNRVRHELRR